MGFHSRRFDRAAATYGPLSQVQQGMADALLALLAGSPDTGRKPLPDGPRILEMGCGTGGFTARLRARFPEAAILATDASPRMLEETARAVPDARLADFDAEGPPERVPREALEAAPFDLAASNALVQWFPDLGGHLRMVAGLLAPAGSYLVSGFLRDNFPELNSILSAEPFGYREFPGHAPEEVEAAAAASGFRVEALRSDRVEAAYPDARAFLQHIKGLGSARRPAEGRPLTRARLDLLARKYREGYGTGSGVRATWRPWLALLRLAR